MTYFSKDQLELGEGVASPNKMEWIINTYKYYYISEHTALNTSVLIACNISLIIGGDSFSDIGCILPLISTANILSRGPEAVKNIEVGSNT